MNFEIRISKSEGISNFQNSNFEFTSNFDIRISDFRFKSLLPPALNTYNKEAL